MQESTEQKYEFASINSRFLAATIDLFLMIVIFAPFMNWLNYYTYDGMNPEMLFESVAVEKGDGTSKIDVLDLYNKMVESGFFLRFFIVQLVMTAAICTYIILFTHFMGQTPGKWAMGHKVITLGGEKPGLLRTIFRTLAYIPTMVPLGLGFLVSVFNDRNRSLHDLIAGTMVIKCKRDFTIFERFRNQFLRK